MSAKEAPQERTERNRAAPERRDTNDESPARQEAGNPASNHWRPGTILRRSYGLSNSAIQSIARQAIARRRQDPEVFIDRFLSWGNLNEDALGRALRARLPGGASFVTTVLDALSSTDRDDVSLAIVEGATDAWLESTARHPDGSAVLVRVVVELLSGYTSDSEAKQVRRLVPVLSPSHRRLLEAEHRARLLELRAEPTRAGVQVQPIAEGIGDVIFDSYSIIIERMPPGLGPDTYLAELAVDLNAAVNNWLFDAINEFRRTSRRGAPREGDVYDIDIAGPENGSVILVERTPAHFVFQTVVATSTGSHPECGAREFGFERLRDGAIRFYTRGASRPSVLGLAGRLPQYLGWRSLMNGIAEELTRRGGQVKADSLQSWTTHRPQSGPLLPSW